MSTNHELFQRALTLMPGGVNSPVRAFKSVGGEPFFTQRADGAYLWDVEGKRYIDYVGSFGPLIRTPEQGARMTVTVPSTSGLRPLPPNIVCGAAKPTWLRRSGSPMPTTGPSRRVPVAIAGRAITFATAACCSMCRVSMR